MTKTKTWKEFCRFHGSDSMTVAQLVTRLSRLNQNAAVFIYTDSGCRESIAIDATLEGIVDLQWEV